jgi:hypothetical protein
MNSRDFSLYERCGRLPSLVNLFEPGQLPIREAAKRYFERGVRYRFSGVENVPQQIREEFVEEASTRGFEYPPGEPYYLAQDHASWLDTVLRLLPSLAVEHCPIIGLEDEYIEVDAYVDGRDAHIFRVSSRFDTKVRWPELFLIGLYDSITVHTFLLPATTKGRLLSPASMAYAHPLTGDLRLARLEGGAFSPSWKRVGRWEVEDSSWEEWNLGINRDRCLGRIYQSHQIAAEYTPEHLQDIKRDAAQIIAALKMPQPRKREVCDGCMYMGLCHGGKDERDSYMRADEAVSRLWAGKGLLPVLRG